MHRLIKLPSGLVLNLSLVTRAVPAADTLEVYFSGGDRAVLTREDAAAFRSQSGLGGPFSTKLKIAIFWLVMIAALLLVYMATRTRG